jgi:8-oxo-dGTP pyrophosphatase MutT (NUDIX family)
MTSVNSSLGNELSGRWGDNITWEFHLSEVLPPSNLCTAVFCLAIVDGLPESIVLARNKRGWELLGGHIEPGESIESTLVREALEEGGFRPTWYRPFGYRKVISTVPVANDHHGGFYPSIGFIPHFIATTSEPITDPTGEEIYESRTFKANALPNIEASELSIIQAGLVAFRS